MTNQKSTQTDVSPSKKTRPPLVVPQNKLLVSVIDPFAIQRATSEPRSLSPNQLIQLQRTIGNRAVTNLLQRRARIQPSFITPRIQRARLNKIDLLDLTLSAFDTHRKAEQFDWANTNGLTKSEKNDVWWLLNKAIGPCGDMKVTDLVTVLADNEKTNHLTMYIDRVSVAKFANDSKLPKVTNIADALKAGKWLTEFHTILKHLTPYEFGRLIADETVATKFSDYLRDVKPTMETENGAESRAFRKFVAEGGDYKKYQPTLPEIHNIHKFTVPALEKLLGDKKDESKTKPLTLIIHAKADHNGAFHRHSGVNEAILKTELIVLAYENLTAKTLADFPKTEFERIAKKYGKGDKITQVMVAGHGSSKSMTLGGADSTTEMTGENKNISFIPLYVERDKYAGFEKLADFWDGFFTDMYKHMGEMETPGKVKFEPRVLLRACLTNANSVEHAAIVKRLQDNHGIDYNTATITDKGVQDKVEEEIVAYINERGSLATQLYNKSPKGKFKVLGANASITSGSVGTVHPGGELGFPSKSDPYVDKSKLEYAEHGHEPLGALRAVVESWAANKVTCHAAMNRRILKAAPGYDDFLIKLIYSLALTKYSNDLLAVNALASTISSLGHLPIPSYMRLKTIKDDKMLGVDFATILGGLLSFAPVTNNKPLVVVLRQYWMLQDNGKRGDFLAALADGAIGMDDDKYVDLVAIVGEIEPLLKLGVHDRGRHLLALYGVMGGTANADAKKYLKDLAVGNTDRLPVDVKNVLTGSIYTEDDVLVTLGLPPSSPPAVAPVLGGKKQFVPNVDTTGNGVNDAYVKPMTPKSMKVTNTFFNAKVRAAPHGSGTLLYKEPSSVVVVGEVRTVDDGEVGYYAVKNKNTLGLGYANKNHFD